MNLVKLARDDTGATAVEYGLVAGLISLACVITFQMLGLSLVAIFQTVIDTLSGAISRAG